MCYGVELDRSVCFHDRVQQDATVHENSPGCLFVSVQDGPTLSEHSQRRTPAFLQ